MITKTHQDRRVEQLDRNAFTRSISGSFRPGHREEVSIIQRFIPSLQLLGILSGSTFEDQLQVAHSFFKDRFFFFPGFNGDRPGFWKTQIIQNGHFQDPTGSDGVLPLRHKWDFFLSGFVCEDFTRILRRLSRIPWVYLPGFQDLFRGLIGLLKLLNFPSGFLQDQVGSFHTTKLTDDP